MIRQWFFPGVLNTGPIQDGIFTIRDGLMNLYVLRAKTGLICIDAGWRCLSVARGFDVLGLDVREVAAVFLTHLHWDHARALGIFSNAEIFVGERERAPLFSGWLRGAPSLTRVGDGQVLKAAGISARVIDTPGHSPGAVSYLVKDKFLFTGDALRLRKGEVLPFPPWFNHDHRTMRRSIRMLAALHGVECLCTGHSGFTNDPAKAFRHWREAIPERRGLEKGQTP